MRRPAGVLAGDAGGSFLADSSGCANGGDCGSRAVVAARPVYDPLAALQDGWPFVVRIDLHSRHLYLDRRIAVAGLGARCALRRSGGAGVAPWRRR